MLCSKCRRSMEQKVADRTGGSRQAATSRVLPQIARLRQYQRLAAEQCVPFAIAEGAAAEMMREPCTACGAPAPVSSSHQPTCSPDHSEAAALVREAMPLLRGRMLVLVGPRLLRRRLSCWSGRGRRSGRLRRRFR